MIKYQLLCDADHDFEGWFRDSADYDDQAGKGLVSCPACGSAEVRKAVMAPAIARRSTGKTSRLADVKKDILQAMHRARDYVEKNFEYVGERFPEEARKIHYGEKDERGIYGQASPKEVRELVDEGVTIAPLPGVKKAEKPKPVADAAPQTPKKLN
ncbi:MAG: DUF1178 family protein [Hyphococcus sp.]